MESPASRRFLERQGLLHAQLDGGAAPGGMGTSSFDESKVKRDAKGMFAKVASKADKLKDASEFDSLEEFDAYMNQVMVEKYGDRVNSETAEEFLRNTPAKDRDRVAMDVMLTVRAGLEVRNKIEDRLAGVKHFDAEDFNAVGHMIRQTLTDLGHTDVDDETFEEIVTNYLAHFGVKGMRWGIRKDRPGVVGRTAEGSKFQPGKPGADGKMRRTITGPDGQQHPLSKDGELVFNAATKLKSGGFGTLTNAEIKAYTERIRLEDELVKTLHPPAPAQSNAQQTSRAPAKKPAVPVRVLKFIGKTLEKEAGNQASRVLNIVATQQINKQLEKKGVEIPNKKKKNKD